MLQITRGVKSGNVGLVQFPRVLLKSRGTRPRTGGQRQGRETLAPCSRRVGRQDERPYQAVRVRRRGALVGGTLQRMGQDEQEIVVLPVELRPRDGRRPDRFEPGRNVTLGG